MSHTARIATWLVAGGVLLLCAVSGVLAVLLLRQLSGLCEAMAVGDLTSPGGRYEANVTRDDCDRNVGTVYTVRIGRDADGFEEPGVSPSLGEELSHEDDVLVRRVSTDELVISGDPRSNVNVVLGSSGVTVRRETP